MDGSCLYSEKQSSCFWARLPSDLWICILAHLSYRDIVNFGTVSKHFHGIASDDILWRYVFQNYWKIKKKLQGRIASCWLDEFKRLFFHSPAIAVATASHTNEVLHVSFSKSGKYLVTSSKDQTIKIFDVSGLKLHFLREIFFGDRWEYVQFTEFSADDRLLLVSGVARNLSFTFKGEIEVFLVDSVIGKTSDDDERPRCEFRVASEPYDAFGCWYNSSALITAFYQLNDLADQENLSVSDLWMFDTNKTSQRKLVRVLNREHASVKLIHVAEPGKRKIVTSPIKGTERMDTTNVEKTLLQNVPGQIHSDGDVTINVSSNVERQEAPNGPTLTVNGKQESDKLLIFVHGTTTYVPHLLVFIRQFNGTLNGENTEMPVVHTGDNNPHSTVRVIDTRSYIIGMALSPDHRYLYVNCRKWVTDSFREEFGLLTPGIDVNIELRKYDIETLELVGVLEGHKAQISVTSCFFIYVDVAQDFVASGAEDNFAHIWERQYNCKVGTLDGHTSVVNAVAFNPKNQEVLASVSDDYTVKLWLSRHLARKAEMGGMDTRSIDV